MNKNTLQNLQLRNTPPKLLRFGQTCWMLSSFQALGGVSWPSECFEYALVHQDLFAKMYQLIHIIRHNVGARDKIHDTRQLASHIISYVNKMKHSMLTELDTDEEWAFNKQEDTQEFLQYFFSMISPIGTSHSISSFQSNNKILIKKIKAYFKDNIIFKSCPKILCHGCNTLFDKFINDSKILNMKNLY